MLNVCCDWIETITVELDWDETATDCQIQMFLQNLYETTAVGPSDLKRLKDNYRNIK